MACPFPTMTDAEDAIFAYEAQGVTDSLVYNTPSGAQARGVLLDVYSQLEFDQVRIEREVSG